MIASEQLGVVRLPNSDVVELSGAALGSLGGAMNHRLSGRVRLRATGDIGVQSLDLGRCEVQRMRLPAFEGWRPGSIGASHRDMPIIAVLHRQGAISFENTEGKTALGGSMLMIHTFYPECVFDTDETTDRTVIRIPAQIMPSRVRRVVYPHILFQRGAVGLPAIFESVVTTALANKERLSPADRGRMQRTLVNLTADLIAMGSEKAATDATLSLANLRARAIGYIEHNLHTVVDVAEVAAAMRCSPRQLYKAFEERGTTPARFIWHRRLECARAQIARGENVSIAEIAYRCGFQSYAHFSRAYKRAFGIAPVETARDAGPAGAR